MLILFVSGAIYLATLNGSYEVSKTRSIEAAPDVVFNELNDFRNWQDWGPWYEKDSTIFETYAEVTVGEGGAFSWTSDIEGGGRIRTIKVQKPEKIDQELIFETPFGEMVSQVHWLLDKTKTGTDLTWMIKGELPFFSRFMVGGMEDQLGAMETRGLELFDENLQEKLSIYMIDSVGVVDFSGGFYLYTSASSKISRMDTKLRQMLEEVEAVVNKNQIRVTGSPFTIYHKLDQENGTTLFSVAVPVAERIVMQDTDLLTGYLERGTYFKIVLEGSYENSKEAWDQAMFYASNLKDYVLLDEGEPFEIYVNRPENTPNPAKYLTEIYLPVKRLQDVAY